MKIEQPEGMRVTLFDHQLESAYSLEHRERVQKVETGTLCIDASVGIFADKPGYGKTLSMLAVVVRDRMSWNLEEPHTKALPDFSDRCNLIHVLRRCELEDIRSNATLIVTSQNIQDHWEREVAKTQLTSFRVTAGSQLVEFDPDLYDVILCPHDLYQTFVRTVDRVWKRAVFDEPESAPIPSMAQIEAGFVWLITSSPALILDKFCAARCSNHFLKRIFRRIPHDVFDRLVVKSDDTFVSESYETALIAAGRRPVLQPRRIVHRCRRPPILAVLGDAVPWNVQAMLAADAVGDAVAALQEGAMQGLPEASSENIVELVLAKLERQRGCAGAESLIDEVTSRFNRMRYDLCPICLVQPMREPVFVECCQNMFGRACLLRWLQTHDTCPLCRDARVKDKALRLAAEATNTEGGAETPKRTRAEGGERAEGGLAPRAELCDETRAEGPAYTHEHKHDETRDEGRILKTKGETMLDIIRTTPGGSFILYSEYDNSATTRATLQSAGIAYVELRGGNIPAKIAKYRSGAVRVLLLTNQRPGAGIGFENTSDLILYHSVDPALEQQLVGRAHRVGRTLAAPLRIHCLEF